MPKNEKANIEITATDKTAKVFKSVGARLDRTGKTLKSVGKQASVVSAGIVAGFGASLVAFDKQEKALAQVRAGLESTNQAAGRTFDQLKKQASDLQRNTLFGDEEILTSVTAQLLTFTNIAETQFDRTQKAALNLATRVGQDLTSSSIQLGKALNDPVANLGALSRSGIQFSKAQKEVIKTMAETGRLAEAQTVILDELENQYGGAAEAAAKAGLGPFKQFQNRIGDIAERVGGALLPMLDRINPYLDRFIKRLENASPEMIAIGTAIAGAVAAAGPLLFVLGQVVTTAATVSTALASVGGVSGALTAAFAALTGPVGIAVAAIAGAGVLIVRNWEQVRGFFESAIGGIVTVFNNWRERNAETISAVGESFGTIKDNLLRIFGAIGSFVSTTTAAVVSQLNEWLAPWGGLETVVGNTLDLITVGLGRLVSFFGDQFGVIADVLEGQTSIWNGFRELVANNSDLILQIVSGIGAGIKQIFAEIDLKAVGLAMLKGLLDAFVSYQQILVNAAIGIGKAIIAALKSIDLVQVGKDLIAGFVRGIKSSGSLAAQAAKDMANSIKSSVTSFLKIDSPSKVFEDIGKFVAQGLAIGIVAGTPLAADAARGLAEESANAFYERYSQVSASAQDKQRALDQFSEAPNRPQPPGANSGLSQVTELAKMNQELNQFYNERIRIATEKEGALSQTVKALETKRSQDTAALQRLTVQSFGDSFESILSSTRNFAGEQSGIYKALFVAQKAFAIAQSIVAIQAGIAQAASLSFPYNLAAMATVAAETASIISTIKSTNLPSFEGGGETGPGPRTGGVDGRGGFPAILHPDELVVDRRRQPRAGGRDIGEGITLYQTISVTGDPSPSTIQAIQNASVQKAVETIADLKSRKRRDRL